MAYNYVIMPDPEQMELDYKSLFFCSTEANVKGRIRECSQRYPGYPVCVYRLDRQQKLITEPVFAMYKVTSDGELIPDA